MTNDGLLMGIQNNGTSDILNAEIKKDYQESMVQLGENKLKKRDEWGAS